MTTDSISAIKHHYSELVIARDSLDYEIDGLVIRADSGEVQTLLGEVGRKPRYAIAWKVPSKMETTRLLDVAFQVGRTGVITPVGILEPVKIEGAKVSRATLHNQNQINDKDLMIGDTVIIYRAGGVIPAVLAVKNKENRSGNEKKILFPKLCPGCSTPLTKIANSDFPGCPNNQCFEKIYQQFQHFVSKDALDIRGLGNKIILKLIEIGSLEKLSDIFKLDVEAIKTAVIQSDTAAKPSSEATTTKENAPLQKQKESSDKEKSAPVETNEKKKKEKDYILPNKILQAINRAKKTTLSKFIYALGIGGVGKTVSEEIATKFVTLEKFIATNFSELKMSANIGDVAAKNVDEYLSAPENQKDILEMVAFGLEAKTTITTTFQSAITGKKILFTGKLSMARQIAREMASKAGGIVLSSLSKNVEIVVTGENPAPKKVKEALENGAEVISEQEFEKRVKNL